MQDRREFLGSLVAVPLLSVFSKPEIDDFPEQVGPYWDAVGVGMENPYVGERVIKVSGENFRATIAVLPEPTPHWAQAIVTPVPVDPEDIVVGHYIVFRHPFLKNPPIWCVCTITEITAWGATAGVIETTRCGDAYKSFARGRTQDSWTVYCKAEGGLFRSINDRLGAGAAYPIVECEATLVEFFNSSGY